MTKKRPLWIPEVCRLDNLKCSICDRRVLRKNDLTWLISYAYDMPEALITYRATHLLPTKCCPGSPRYAQYLPGQPLDPTDTVYDTRRECALRVAYGMMHREHEDWHKVARRPQAGKYWKVQYWCFTFHVGRYAITLWPFNWRKPDINWPDFGFGPLLFQKDY